MERAADVAPVAPRSRRRFGGAEWFLAIGLVVVVGTALLLAFQPGFIARVNGQLLSWQELAVTYGYLGVFLAMFVGNLTIMIVFPATVVPFLVAAAGADAFWVGVASGVGADLGEFSGYVLGYLGSGLVANRYPDSYAMLRRIIAKRAWAVWVLLFLFSLFPLPDDVLFIPLGIARYGWWKVMIPSLLGKTMAGWAIAYGGAVSADVLAQRTLSSGTVFIQLGVLAFLVVFTYALMRIPWNVVIKRFDR